jgi:hypothetical protein
MGKYWKSLSGLDYRTWEDEYFAELLITDINGDSKWISTNIPKLEVEHSKRYIRNPYPAIAWAFYAAIALTAIVLAIYQSGRIQ